MRTILLASILLLSCSSDGADDGGGGGGGGPGQGLTCEERAAATTILAERESALGLWRDDGRRAVLGEGSDLANSTILEMDERQLVIQTVAGEMTFGWPGPIPSELKDAATWTGRIQQRSSWDLFILPEVTLALWLSTDAAAPAGVPAIDLPVATLEESCRLEEDCGAIVLDAVVHGDVTIAPGATAEVDGWRITNHGVLRPDGCDAERVAIVSAIR